MFHPGSISARQISGAVRSTATARSNSYAAPGGASRAVSTSSMLVSSLWTRPGYARAASPVGQREERMPDSLHVRIGEERPVRLPALTGGGTWSCDVSGMSSAVEVRKLWAADPYPEDDDEEEEQRESPEVV